MKNKNSEIFNWYLYFFCQLVSNLGNIMQMSVIPLLIWDKTQSGAAMGVITGSLSLLYIFTSFFSGLLADKYHRKNILIATDLLNGVIIILYLILVPVFSLKSLIILMGLGTIITSFFNSANSAMFSQIAPKNSIEKANSLFTTGRNCIAIIAPVLGIYIYTKYSFNTLIFINMLSFLISGFLEIFLKVRTFESSVKEKQKGYKEVFDFFKVHDVIKDLTILSILLNLIVAPLLGITLIFLIKEGVKMPDTYIGYLQSLIPVGLILGSTFVYKFGEKLNLRKKYLDLIFFQSTFILIYYLFLGPLYHSHRLIGITFFAGIIIFIFIINSAILIPNISLLHLVVDNKIKGRYFTLVSSLKMGLVPVMVAIIGFLLDKVDIKIIAILLISISFITQYYFVKLKKLKLRYYQYLKIYNDYK